MTTHGHTDSVPLSLLELLIAAKKNKSSRGRNLQKYKHKYCLRYLLASFPTEIILGKNYKISLFPFQNKPVWCFYTFLEGLCIYHVTRLRSQVIVLVVFILIIWTNSLGHTSSDINPAKLFLSTNQKFMVEVGVQPHSLKQSPGTILETLQDFSLIFFFFKHNISWLLWGQAH